MNFRLLARRVGVATAAVCSAAALLAPAGASASLTMVRPSPSDGATFFGHGGYSADGLGQSGTTGGAIQAEVPAGSTVEQAYLYGTYSRQTAMLGESDRTIPFDGTAVVLTQIYGPASGLASARADVTAQVKAKVGTGGTTPTDFVVGAEPARLEGLALVVIYSNPALPEATVAVLEGGAAPAGDVARFAFATPLNTATEGFAARMSLGIGYSAQGAGHTCSGGQRSTVDVNDQRLTSCAGGSDDGALANGALITVGGVGDVLDTPADPNAVTGTDDELYNLTPFLHAGDTTLDVKTANPTNDDNIFLAVIQVTARAEVSQPSAPVNSGTPAASGTAEVGSTLTGSAGTWTGDTSRTGRWQRCTTTNVASCTDIAGATQATYVPSADDKDRYLRYVVRATNSIGTTTAASALTAKVGAQQAPASTGAPVVTGSAEIGHTLTATDGTWTRGASHTYQWQRCASDDASTCADIPGATQATYAVTAADESTLLRVVVTARNAAGAATAGSALTARVPVAPKPAAAPVPAAAPAPAKPAPQSPAPAAFAVRMPASTVSAGLTVRPGESPAAAPRVSLPLVCPARTAGCEASGTLSIDAAALSGGRARAAAAAKKMAVLARFTGVRISAGRKALVSIKLKPSTVRSLQRRGIRRVSAVLRVTNEQRGAATVRSTQTVVLRIPAVKRRLPTRAPKFTG